MNQNKLLAGGFKNLNSTSYINCTLQIFLHFHPFIEQINLISPSPNNENYSLILSLQSLIKKLKTTDGSLSSDAIISAMNLDPKICQPINRFFLYFRFLVSFNILKFELGDCETSITEGINSYINNSNEINSNDLNNDFIYIHLTPNNHKLYDVSEEIKIFGISFALYAVVQVILSPTSHNHYFVTIHDNKGWVLFNDTAVTEIDYDHFVNSIHNMITPIEILIYIKNISDSEINRKPASLQSTFVDPKPPHDQKDVDKNVNSIAGAYDRGANPEDIESIIQRNESEEDCPRLYHDTVIEVGSTDDEPQVQRPVRAKPLLINSDPLQRKYRKKTRSDSSDEDEKRKHITDEHTHNYPQNDSLKYGTILRGNFNRVKNPFINDHNPRTKLYDSSSECSVSFFLEDQKNEVFNHTFKSYQNYSDIDECIRNTIPHDFKSYLKYKNKYFNVPPDKEIKIIQKLIGKNDFSILIADNHDDNGISSIDLLYFETEDHFNFKENISVTCSIDSTCQDLIKIFSEEYSFLKDPAIFYFNKDSHQFEEIDKNEYIIKIASLPNLRVQENLKKKNMVVFEYKQPFLYKLMPFITKTKLKSDVANYLSLDSVSLVFMDNMNRPVNIENDFLGYYKKKLFSYVLVEDAD